MSDDLMKRKRRVSLSIEEIDLLQASLGGLTIQSAKDLRARLKEIIAEELSEDRRAVVQAYRLAASDETDDFEVDDDAEVSLGDDPGAYVMVWKWVDAADAGICVSCGSPNADNGEGYDGLCGECADQDEKERTCTKCGATYDDPEKLDCNMCESCADQT